MKVLRKHCPQAMMIEGVYLEDVVDGYMTLGVGGREDLQYDPVTKEIGNLDGSLYLSRKLPTRTLKVSYRVVIDPGRSDGRTPQEVINRLNHLTSKEEAKISFADDLTDGITKYYVATRIKHEIKSINDNIIFGGFEFLCHDPLRYSTVVKMTKASVQNGVLKATINNQGTAPATLDYRITTKSNTNYVGIASAEGVMQFGTPSVLNDSNESGSNTVFTMSDFVNGSPSVDNILKPWRTANYVQPSMDVGVSRRPILAVTRDVAEYNNNGWQWRIFLENPQDCFDATYDNHWFTATHTYTLQEPQRDWYCNFNHTFATSTVDQTGEFSIVFLTNSNVVIAGVRIYKNEKMTNNTAKVEFFMNNALKKHDITFTPSVWVQNHYRPTHGGDEVLKQGNMVRFQYGGMFYKFYDNAVNSDAYKCAKVQVCISHHSSWYKYQIRQQEYLESLKRNYENSTDPNKKDPKVEEHPDWGKDPVQKLAEMHLADCALRNIRFDSLTKNIKEVTKTYPANTRLDIDGAFGKVFVNSKYSPGDECLGTTYFKAPPGTSTIEFKVPAGAQYPDVEVRWREAWL